MAGKAGFRVWPRPDAVLLEAFGSAAPGKIEDSMMPMGAMDAAIRSIWHSPQIIGPALTMWLHSGDNFILNKALTMTVPGDILVINTQGNMATRRLAGFWARAR